MFSKQLIALGAITVAATLAVPAVTVAAGGGTTVTVRVQGLKRQLLAPTQVATRSGSVTKGGTPKGSCPATSAAGALNAATHGHWTAKYDKSFGLEVIGILGEDHGFSSKDFWEIFVDNAVSESGACELKLKPGEQLLFAAEPIKGATEYPTALELPAHIAAGTPFTARVVAYDAKGKAKPLAGARVSYAGKSKTTGAKGTVSLEVGKTGNIVFSATHSGYLQAAPVTVRVSS